MLKENQPTSAKTEIETYLNVLSSPEGKKLRPILVLDVDDTIFECMLKHYSVWKQWISEKKWGENTPKLIAFTNFLKSGGSKSYLQHFIDNPELTEADFHQANSGNIVDPNFNKNMGLAPKSKEALDPFSELVGFYLTARPENMEEVTVEELRKHGFPNPDNIICAPELGAYDQPADFKIRELQRIQKETGQLVILIDDSHSTCKAVEALGNPQIKAFRIDIYGDCRDELKEQNTWLMAGEFIRRYLQLAADSFLSQ